MWQLDLTEITNLIDDHVRKSKTNELVPISFGGKKDPYCDFVNAEGIKLNYFYFAFDRQ